MFVDKTGERIYNKEEDILIGNGEKMFYYELHSHTNAASLCSQVEPEEYIRFYMDRGYSGMVVTDHFYYGNTSVNRRLPWDVFVDEFCEGYYRAKREGDKRGFTVLFGFEQKFTEGTDEYIVLGISPEWLKAHPEIRDMKRVPFFKKIREAGGFVIQAHPYRICYYISDIRLALDYVDAIEVLNIGHNDKYSRQAYEYAKNLGLPITGGSDIHSIENREVVSGVALEREIFTVEELIEEIRQRRAVPLPEERFEALKEMPLETALERDVYKLTDDGLVRTYDLFAKR